MASLLMNCNCSCLLSSHNRASTPSPLSRCPLPLSPPSFCTRILLRKWQHFSPPIGVEHKQQQQQSDVYNSHQVFCRSSSSDNESLPSIDNDHLPSTSTSSSTSSSSSAPTPAQLYSCDRRHVLCLGTAGAAIGAFQGRSIAALADQGQGQGQGQGKGKGQGQGQGQEHGLVQGRSIAVIAEDAGAPPNPMEQPPPPTEKPPPTNRPNGNPTTGSTTSTGKGKVDITITDKVYLDLTLCPSASRSDRTMGNRSQLCTVGEPLGRIVIGLYGRVVPQTVKNFKAMITGAAGASYAGTIFHRVLAGRYIQAGKQGSRDRGEVSGLLKLARNQETVSSKSYALTHNRPGTVSLALAENDDDDNMKLDIDYRNVQFLITTGPGPAPQLDSRNIVFGTVMEGLDVVAAVAKVPTYQPNERIRQFNDFAAFIGDERAANARNFWDKPLKSVVISGCGELQMGFPVFPFGLP